MRPTTTTRNNDTICTLFIRIIDPRQIPFHIRELARSTIRVLSVIVSLRHATVRDLAVGLVHMCILYAQCCVFGVTIFGDSGLMEFVSLGVETQLVTCVVSQLAMVFFSHITINTAGPDVVTTIFLSEIALTVRDTMVQKAEDAAAAVPPIVGQVITPSPTTNTPHGHLPDYSGVNRQSLLATVLAAISIATAAHGIFLYVMGRLELSKTVQLVPGAVVAGFTASIGSMILQKSLKTAVPTVIFNQGPGVNQFWIYASPSLVIGILLYLSRRLKLGNPVLVFPAALLVPLAIFYGALFGSGSNWDQARTQGWLNPIFEDELFTSIYARSYGAHLLVDWDAITSAVPDMILLLFLGTLDVLAKLNSIRKMLSAHDLDMNHELGLLGKSNIINGILVGATGLALPKHVAISTAGKAKRISGLLVPVISGVLLLASYPLVNFLPRFWLSSILVFSCLPFLIDNLWDSRKRFTRKEFACTWTIVIINYFFGLPWAIIVGIVLSALIFAAAYAAGSGAVKSVDSAAQMRSCVLRSDRINAKLELLGMRAVVLRLHRFIFFGSAAYVAEVVQGLLQEQMRARNEIKVSYFCFDWTHVEDLDTSAMEVIQMLLAKLLSYSNATGCVFTLLFTGVTRRLRKRLVKENFLAPIYSPAWRAHATTAICEADDRRAGVPVEEQRCFDTLDSGLQWLEERFLVMNDVVRQRWLKLDPCVGKFAARWGLCNGHDVFEHLVVGLGNDFGRYIKAICVTHSSLVSKNTFDSNIYVLRRGRLAIKSHHGATLQVLEREAVVNMDAVLSTGSGGGQVSNTITLAGDCPVAVVFAMDANTWHDVKEIYPRQALALQTYFLAYTNRCVHKWTTSIMLEMNEVDGDDDDEVTTDHGLVAVVPGDDAAVVENGEHNTTNNNEEQEWDARTIIPSALMDAGDAFTNKASQGIQKSTETLTFVGHEVVGGLSLGLQHSSAFINRTAEGVADIVGGSSAVGKVVVSQAGHVLGTASKATRELIGTTASAVRGGLILSGLRQDDDDDDEKQQDGGGEEAGLLLNTAALRAGAGEESGRLLARRNARRRALANGATQVQKSFGSFRQYREATVPSFAVDGIDVGTVVKAIRAMTCVDVPPPVTVVPQLRVNAMRKLETISRFVCCAADSLPDKTTVDDRRLNDILPGLTAPAKLCNQALVEMGVENVQVEDENIAVNFETFLDLVTRGSMKQHIDEKDLLCVQAVCATTQNGELTMTELVALIDNYRKGSSLCDCHELMAHWGPLDYHGLCSMLATYDKTCELDDDMDAFWSRLTSETRGILMMNVVARTLQEWTDGQNVEEMFFLAGGVKIKSGDAEEQEEDLGLELGVFWDEVRGV